MNKVARRDFQRVFNLIGAHSGPFLLLTTAEGVPSALFTIGMAQAMKVILEYFTHPETSSLWPILAIAGGLLFGILYLPAMRYRLNARTEMIMRDVRVRIFEHLQWLPLRYFDTHHSGDVIARLNKDAETFRGAIESFSRFLGTVIGMALYLPYVLALDLRFGAISLGASVLATAVNLRFVRPMRDKSRDIHEKNALLSEAIAENVSGFTVIRLFGLGPHFTKRFRRILEEVFNFQIDRMRLSATLYTANVLIGWLNRGLLAILGCLLAISGRLEIGVVVATIPICTSLTFILMSFTEQFAVLQQNFAGVDRVYELLAEPREPERFQQSGEHRVHSDGLALEKARFGYTDNSPVIDDISLRAGPGNRIALVGDSGGGKSTLIKLIASMYELDDGILGFSGREISEFSLEEWRDLIAYVPQDAYIFDGTIWENIIVSRPDAPGLLVDEVARKAHAYEFIMSHAHGYETVVGERGIKLSGGERQRIAIARALLKDAPILLLDEATSSLDSESELLVQTALEELMAGRISVIVAHRLSTIQSVDEICFVKNGTISERGTHEELLSRGGEYSELYYRDFSEAENGPTN